MRVMYFAFEGFDNPNGTNHLAIKMIDYLLSQGIEVYLLSSHTKGIDDDIPDILKNRKGFTYDIVNRSVVNKQNFVQRYLDGIKYAYNCKKKWHPQKANIDAVILQSTPTVFFSARLLKKYVQKPVVFNSFDVFPNVAYDTGALTNKFVFKILLEMQKRVYDSCDQIVVISNDMKKTLVKQGVASEKITEIRNWYDDKTIHYVSNEENKFKQEYKISDEYFYVQYAGNFGFTFNYRYILDVADLLKSNKGIRFQMIGDGAFQKSFMEEATTRGLDNIDFYPWQKPEMISDVYSCCDISLIPLASGVIQNSFPSKGSLLMACGKVVLCATEVNSDYYKMINDNGVGICVSNTDPKEAAAAILKVFDNKQQLQIIGEKARIFGEKYYSSTNNLPKYVEVLEKYEKSSRKESEVNV